MNQVIFVLLFVLAQLPPLNRLMPAYDDETMVGCEFGYINYEFPLYDSFGIPEDFSNTGGEVIFSNGYDYITVPLIFDHPEPPAYYLDLPDVLYYHWNIDTRLTTGTWRLIDAWVTVDGNENTPGKVTLVKQLDICWVTDIPIILNKAK